MSRAITVTCDSCGIAKDERTIETDVDVAWWDFQYSSTDFPTGDHRMWRFLSASWDLCPTCAAKARDAMIAAVGEPSHESVDLDELAVADKS